MRLEPLFKKSFTGKIQRWEIEVKGNTIITTWGVEGGKMQSTSDVIANGKNIGKSNETTPEEQAVAEAKATHKKKLKSGYVLSIADAEADKTDSIIKGGINPMLAEKWAEQKHKIQYPTFVQPKLDGHRGIAMYDFVSKKATLWTRQRNKITGLPHIEKAIEALGFTEDTVLDGELYSHELSLQQISSIASADEPKPDSEKIGYHLYDIVLKDVSFTERNNILKSLLRNVTYPLHYVETESAASEEDVMKYFEAKLAQGYEGAMVRTRDSQYVNRRSPELLKVKKFDSNEYRVVTVKAGRGKMANKAIFICQSPNPDKTFECKLKGPLENLEKFLEDPSLVVGKLLEVEHSGYTDDGVPWHPVGLRIRYDLP